MHHAKKTNFICLAQWTLLLLQANFVRPAPKRWVDTLPTFLDPNAFDSNIIINRLVVDHNTTGDVFVAGRNYLYRLSADLKLKQSVSTGPVQDYPGCPIPPYPCSEPRVETDNDASLMQLFYNLGDTPSLLLCGTVYNRLCQVRSTDNLEEYHWVHPYNDTLGYATNGVLNYAQLEPGFDGRLSLFTAAQDDGSSRTMNSAPYLSSRVLEKDGDRYSFQYTFKNDSVSSAVTIKGNKLRYPMDGGFVYGNYIYFPIIYFSNSKIVGSRLVRFCTTDPTFQSYAELPIRCNYAGQVFKRLMAAHLGDSHTSGGKALYLSFNEDRTGTALCIFEMSAIIEAFTTSARSCNRDIVGETCDQKVETDIVNFCGSDVSPYVVSKPLEIDSFVFVTNVVLIAVTVVKQYDDVVIIAGSNKGILVKISRSTGKVINVKDMLEPVITSPFVSPFLFDREEKHIYLLLKHKVIKYPVGTCGVHETCEDCFSRGKEDPLKCGWCAGRCAHREECTEPGSYNTDTCTPVIDEVFPQKGPIQGGNTVTITGKTFGSYVDDDHNSILVAGIPCAVTSWNNTQVNCTLGSTPEVLSGPVQLSVINTFSSALGYNVAGSTFSQSNFSYYVGVRLYGIRPNKGPTSGGTIVSLIGQDLDFEKDKKRFVTVRGRLCKVKQFDSNFIYCITGNTSSTMFPSGTTAIYIDGVAYVMDKHPPSTFKKMGLSQTFEYTRDPYINHIRPGITTLSGLMNLTAIGFNLDSIRFPKLVVNFDKETQAIDKSELIENCWVDPKYNGTTMTCRTPNLKERLIFPIPTRTHPCMTQISFIMDGVQALRDFPTHREDLSRLLYYPDPKFTVFQETEKIKVDQTVLEIKGTYLDLMHLADNLRVRIGNDESCKIASVSSDVLFCDIPPSLLSNSSLSGTNLSVEVFTGSTMHHLGYIEFDQQEGERIKLWHIPILWAVAAVVIVSCVIFVLYKWWNHLRRKPLRIEVPLENRTFNNYTRVPTSAMDTPGPSPNAVAACVAKSPCAAAAAVPPWMAYLDEDTRFELADKDLIIQEERLGKGGKIGSGAFGCVCEGYIKNSDQTKTKVAVKTLHENSWNKPENVAIFLGEALIMKNFKHDNVIRLLGVCFEESGPSIVLEFMVNKDLHSYIKDVEKECIFTVELLKFAVDVSAGMSYLENEKFVHRDLATRNCLLDHAVNAKVADFGLSRDIYEDGNYVGNTKGKIPYPWTAPEALLDRLYTTKSDVWSFGVLLWELMTRGVRPYNHIDNLDLLRYLQRGSRLDQPKSCPLPLYQVMVGCWNLDPDLRPSFYDLNAIVTMLRNVILENDQVEAPPAPAAIPTQDSVYYNAAIPPCYRECHNSEELYLSMEGRALDRNFLAAFR